MTIGLFIIVIEYGHTEWIDYQMLKRQSTAAVSILTSLHVCPVVLMLIPTKAGIVMMKTDFQQYNPPIPNVQLLVNNNRITVIQNGKQIDQVNFEIIKMPGYLQLKTKAQPRADNWYVRDPSLQVSRNRLFLDTGVATDLPAFSFERIKQIFYKDFRRTLY